MNLVSFENHKIIKQMINDNFSPFPAYRKFFFYLIDQNDYRLNEVDVIDNKIMETDFSSLKEKQDKFKELGLFGMGGKIYLDLNTGVFHLDGKQTLVFGMQYDGKTVCFENIEERKDFDFHNIIQLKKAFTDFSPKNPANGNKSTQTKMTVSDHIIGYSLRIDIDEEQYFDCEIIFILPVNGGSYRSGFNITPYLKNEETKEIYLMSKRNNTISAQKVQVTNKVQSRFEMVI